MQFKPRSNRSVIRGRQEEAQTTIATIAFSLCLLELTGGERSPLSFTSISIPCTRVHLTYENIDIYMGISHIVQPLTHNMVDIQFDLFRASRERNRTQHLERIKKIIPRTLAYELWQK